MDSKTVGLVLITLGVFGLTAVQLLIKARLEVHGPAPLSPGELFGYVVGLLADWQVWVAGITLIVAAAFWYIALSRLPLSIAFPFGALSYPLIFLGSLVFLREGFSWQILAGNVAIVLGVLLVASAGTA